jgi:hypothetical protein
MSENGTALEPRLSPGPSRGPSRAAAAFPLITVTVLACAAMLAGSAVSAVGLVAAVALVQAALVASWVFGIGLPGRIGALVIGLLTTAGADAVVVKGHEHGYQPVLAVLGLAIPAMFLHQLTRGVVRARVVESLSDIAILLLAVCAMAGLVVLRYQGAGERTVLAVVAAAGVALVVGQLTDLVWPALRFDPRVDRGLPALLTGVLAGGAVSYGVLHSVLNFAGLRSAFAGAAVAAVACLLAVGASFIGAHSTLSPLDRGPRDPDSDVRAWPGVPRLRPVAAALLVLALSSPAGYVLINALGNQ